MATSSPELSQTLSQRPKNDPTLADYAPQTHVFHGPMSGLRLVYQDQMRGQYFKDGPAPALKAKVDFPLTDDEKTCLARWACKNDYIFSSTNVTYSAGRRAELDRVREELLSELGISNGAKVLEGRILFRHVIQVELQLQSTNLLTLPYNSSTSDAQERPKKKAGKPRDPRWLPSFAYAKEDGWDGKFFDPPYDPVRLPELLLHYGELGCYSPKELEETKKGIEDLLTAARKGPAHSMAHLPGFVSENNSYIPKSRRSQLRDQGMCDSEENIEKKGPTSHSVGEPENQDKENFMAATPASGCAPASSSGVQDPLKNGTSTSTPVEHDQDSDHTIKELQQISSQADENANGQACETSENGASQDTSQATARLPIRNQKINLNPVADDFVKAEASSPHRDGATPSDATTFSRKRSLEQASQGRTGTTSPSPARKTRKITTGRNSLLLETLPLTTSAANSTDVGQLHRADPTTNSEDKG